MDPRTDRAIRIFRERFGGEPEAVAFAPGRLEILGNHTDYNEGLILLCAVEQGIAAAGRARADGKVRIHSEALGQTAEFDAGLPYPEGQPSFGRYCYGVLRALKRRGVPASGFDAALASDLAPESGLSSSAALMAACARLILALRPFDIPDLDLARACQEAENLHAGVPCGILDPVGSLFGADGMLLRLDARTLEITRIPWPAGLSLAILDGGVPRALGDGRFARRRLECEEAARRLSEALRRHIPALRDVTTEDVERADRALPEPLGRRARHITGENERVEAAGSALAKGDAAAFGRLLTESHESSRRLFENSHPILDDLVRIACGIPGVLGARLSGGGFGGMALAVARTEAMPELRARLPEAFRAIHGRPAAILETRPAGGAWGRRV